MNRIITIVAMILISQLIAHRARAEETYDLRFGAKGTLTGLLWSEPDNTPPVTDGFWGDNQFYYGGGGGLFVEGNAFGYLGLEIDLLFEFNSLTFNYTFNNFEYDYYTRFDQLRIPILLKGLLPLGKSVEMSLGIGPEFVVGLGAEVETDPQIVESRYDAEKEGGTFFDVNLGIGIKVWKLIVPIDLRAAFNLSQPSDYDERVTLRFNTVSGPVNGTVKAIESMHFAALVGVGYLLPLE